MSFDELIRDGFEIRDGKFYPRTGGSTCFTVQKFGWGGDEYKINGDYDVTCNYSINTDAYGEWYLMRGYTKVCALQHLGGENWRKC